MASASLDIAPLIITELGSAAGEAFYDDIHHSRAVALATVGWFRSEFFQPLPTTIVGRILRGGLHGRSIGDVYVFNGVELKPGANLCAIFAQCRRWRYPLQPSSGPARGPFENRLSQILARTGKMPIMQRIGTRPPVRP
jgi:hypothetical protein